MTYYKNPPKTSKHCSEIVVGYLKPSNGIQWNDALRDAQAVAKYMVSVVIPQLPEYDIKEHMVVIPLKPNCKPMGWHFQSKGNATATLADPAQIFGMVLRTNANRFVLVHNHPSGNLTPSRADISLTRRCYEAGRLLGVELADHVIITDTSYKSMRQEGFI